MKNVEESIKRKKKHFKQGSEIKLFCVDEGFKRILKHF